MGVALSRRDGDWLPRFSRTCPGKAGFFFRASLLAVALTMAWAELWRSRPWAWVSLLLVPQARLTRLGGVTGDVLRTQNKWSMLFLLLIPALVVLP